MFSFSTDRVITMMVDMTRLVDSGPRPAGVRSGHRRQTNAVAPDPMSAARLLRPYRRSLGVVVGLSLTDTVLDLARPWPLQLAVDHAIGGRPFGGWLRPLGSLSRPSLAGLAAAAGVVLVVAGGLLGYLTTYLGSVTAERVGADLRNVIFGRLMTMSIRFHDRNRTGELVTRLTDDTYRVQDAMVAWVTTLLPEVLTLVGMVVVMMLIDVPLAVTALSVMPVLVVVVVARRRRIGEAQRRARHQEGRLAAHATEALRNVRAIQAFGRGTLAGERFGDQNAAALGVTVRAIDLEARYSPLADLVLAFGGAAVLWFGVVRVIRGTITLGLLLVVLSYLASLYGPVRSLSRLGRTMAKASVSRQRIAEVLDSGEVVVEEPEPAVARPLAHSLVVERVDFSYSPDEPVLAGAVVDGASR